LKVCGIDPGITGAATLITGGSGISIVTVDIPITGEKKQRRVDYRAFRDLLRRWQPDVLYFENVRAFIGRGVISAGKFGHSIGALEAICACEVDNCHLVLPQVWKRHFNLLKTTKEDSRQLALKLFPAHAKRLARKGDHNRADSFLIAVYGAIRQGMLRIE
jgi:crossover junction endodeoxyribonuclease RuvC